MGTYGTQRSFIRASFSVRSLFLPLHDEHAAAVLSQQRGSPPREVGRTCSMVSACFPQKTHLLLSRRRTPWRDHASGPYLNGTRTYFSSRMMTGHGCVVSLDRMNLPGSAS